jgi:hypothetical protein
MTARKTLHFLILLLLFAVIATAFMLVAAYRLTAPKEQKWLS